MRYRNWIIIATLVFSVGLLLGMVTQNEALRDLIPIEEYGEMLSPLPQSDFFLFILFNNIFTLLLSFFLSPLLLVVPVLSLTANGWVLAFIGGWVVEQESLGFLLAGVLPHGVFELPALIIAQAAALSFGATVIVAVFREEKRPLVLPSLKQNTRYLGIALLLLVPAAIIETYVTPLLL
jgi:stage II sporulation protein M